MRFPATTPLVPRDAAKLRGAGLGGLLPISSLQEAVVVVKQETCCQAVNLCKSQLSSSGKLVVEQLTCASVSCCQAVNLCKSQLSSSGKLVVKQSTCASVSCCQAVNLCKSQLSSSGTLVVKQLKLMLSSDVIFSQLAAMK